MQKTPVLILITAIIAGAAFYGGMLYGAGKNSKTAGSQSQFGSNNFRGNGQGQNAAGRQRRIPGQGGDFVNGEIIKKDEASITIKLPDGSSKIIFFTDSTKVAKSVDGTIKDLSVGNEIVATGKADNSGGIVAQNLQIRPPRLNQGQPDQGSDPKQSASPSPNGIK